MSSTTISTTTFEYKGRQSSFIYSTAIYVIHMQPLNMHLEQLQVSCNDEIASEISR